MAATKSAVSPEGLDLNDFYLDIFGQQPALKIYTQICLCYPVPDPSLEPTIIAVLREGLARLSESFPWTAGQVVQEVSPRPSGSDGPADVIIKIKPLEKSPRLVVKDLRQDPSMPAMTELRRARFPMSILDEAVVAPRRTLPGSPDEPISDPLPVFAVQATFVEGGLLLTFVGEHGSMDMTGQAFVMHLLNKACHGEAFTGEELRVGNMDRRNAIPLLDESYDDAELWAEVPGRAAHPSEAPDNTSSALPQPPPPPCSWACFGFSASSLAALKDRAMQTIPASSPVGYVSTDDAVTAFIWECTTRARLPRLQAQSPPGRLTTMLARAVDPRPYIGLPLAYPGLVQSMTYHTHDASELAEGQRLPLGALASELRAAVDPKTSNLGHATRAFATALHRARDRNVVNVTSQVDPSRDVMLSSWVKAGGYCELDFGLGIGKPECVRRPRFVPAEGLMYLVKSRSGDSQTVENEAVASDEQISLAACLRDEDLERLRTDAEFSKYAEYIG